MPDIDVFFGSVPWEPLAMHRGFTHSLVGGVVVMPPILFGLLLLLDRWQLSRGATFKSGLAMRPGWLLALCYIGALSHPLLDLLTTYSVQLLSPFSGAWFHADGLFIIDVWVWVLLAASIEWSRWKEKAGRAVATAGAGGDRDPARLHRDQPAHHAARLCGGPKLGGRSAGRCPLRLAAARPVLAPRASSGAKAIVIAGASSIRSAAGSAR